MSRNHHVSLTFLRWKKIFFDISFLWRFFIIKPTIHFCSMDWLKDHEIWRYYFNIKIIYGMSIEMKIEFSQYNIKLNVFGLKRITTPSYVLILSVTSFALFPTLHNSFNCYLKLLRRRQRLNATTTLYFLAFILI